MNYFRLFNSVGPDVGFVPQVYDAVANFNIHDPTSSYHLNFSQANETTLWPIPKLSGKAKKTDLISSSFMGLSGRLIVSSKLYNVLSKFKSKGIEFIQSELIIRSNKVEDYWIVNPFLSDYSFLDISNCEFIYTDSMGNEEFDLVKFKSIEDFFKAYEQNKKDAVSIGYPLHRPLKFKKIIFKKENLFDFVSVAAVSWGYFGYFISERLKKEIEDAGCTGIVFKGLNERYP